MGRRGGENTSTAGGRGVNRLPEEWGIEGKGGRMSLLGRGKKKKKKKGREIV